jgi:hypothetical protein
MLAAVAVPGQPIPGAGGPRDRSVPLGGLGLRRSSRPEHDSRPDPAYRSDGALNSPRSFRPGLVACTRGPPRFDRAQPESPRGVVVLHVARFDGNISWYGPGVYGTNRLRPGDDSRCSAWPIAPCRAAHGHLPQPRQRSTITVPVIRSRAYVSGRSGTDTGTCAALGHLYTDTSTGAALGQSL